MQEVYENECLISYSPISVSASYLVREELPDNNFSYYYIFNKENLDKIKICLLSDRPLAYLYKVKLSDIPKNILLSMTDKKTNKLFEHEELCNIKELLEQLPWTYVQKPTTESIIFDLQNNRNDLSRYENFETLDFSDFNLEGIIIRDKDLSGKDFSRSNLKNAKLLNINFTKVNFEDVNLDAAEFQPSSLAGVKHLTSKQLLRANIQIDFLLTTIAQKIEMLHTPAISSALKKIGADMVEAIPKLLNLKINLKKYVFNLQKKFSSSDATQKDKIHVLFNLADLELKLDLTIAFNLEIEKILIPPTIELKQRLKHINHLFSVYEREMNTSWLNKTTVLNSFSVAGFMAGSLAGMMLTSYLSRSDIHSDFKIQYSTSALIGALGSFGFRKAGNFFLEHYGFFREKSLEVQLSEFAEDVKKSIHP